MRSELEKEYLLKAVDAFQRRFIVVSPDFTILAANCAPEQTQDCDVVGKHCHEVYYERDTPCEGCAVKEIIEGGKPVLRAKPSETLELGHMSCYYGYPIYTGDRVEAFVSMDFDLPTVGALEERLQHSNALLRNFISSAVDGVIAADKNGKILIFNEAAQAVFGFSEEEALSNVNIRDIYPAGKEYAVMRKLRSSDHGGKGKLNAYHVDVVTKSGAIVPISLNAAIVYEEGREVATVGFFHDRRDKLRMKAELEKTQLQLLQSEKMASLGKLAAGVAHQLNNPLAGITLFTKLVMEEYDLPAGAQEDMQRILGDTQRCRDTVKELLEFARQTKHLLQPVNINDAVTRTLFLLENQTLFHNIEIVKSLDERLPQVAADIQQLNHMLMNIILNAAQAMQGQGKLEIKTQRSSSVGKVEIEIADSGPGIAPEILARVFEPFFTTKIEGEGTGLGLSLVYGIVENHGGSIRASNRPEGGAQFNIELPIENRNKGGADGSQSQ